MKSNEINKKLLVEIEQLKNKNSALEKAGKELRDKNKAGDKREIKIIGKDKVILIVEDDDLSYQFIKIIVERAGFKTIWVKNGKDAVSSCRENPAIQLVLMDIQLPIMNGYEATREIRKFNSGLPVIAQTAYAIKSDKEIAITAGCDDYITKPIDPKLLIGKIKQFIEK